MRFRFVAFLIATGLIAASLIAGALQGSVARAQEYPTRPIRIIVATSPGGVSDIFLRALSDPMHQRLGQPLVIENRPGGNMIIAARQCAEAPPDGYTLCVMPGEPLNLQPVSIQVSSLRSRQELSAGYELLLHNAALGVGAALNVGSLEELAAYSKAKAGTLSYSAPSSSQIVFMESWKQATGADLVKVPFKGGGDTVTGMLSGSTPVGFLGLGNLLSYVRAGSIAPLLVDSEKRSALVPDVPTMGETGFARDHTRAFFGLLAPAGTPRAIVDRLRRETVRIVNEPAFMNRHFTERGLEPVLNTPEEFRSFLQADRTRAARIVKAAGIAPQ